MCVFMLRAGCHILFIITELIYNYNYKKYNYNNYKQ